MDSIFPCPKAFFMPPFPLSQQVAKDNTSTSITITNDVLLDLRD